MTLFEFIVYVIVAGVCGAIARAIAGGTGRGFILSVMLGFLGAFVGAWLARLAHLPVGVIVAIGGHPFPIVWSIVGGFVLVLLSQALLGGPRRTFVRFR